MELFQQIIFGVVQGIFEWIPISSEGILLLVSSNFFGEVNMELFIKQALFLHFGTFLAALVYFRKDVKELFVALFDYKHTDTETKRILNFLAISTLISGVLGLAMLNFFKFVNPDNFSFAANYINLFVGFLLIVTGMMQLKASSAGYKKELHLSNSDGILLGLAQGVAVLPGLSRSGLTVSSLLFRNFDETVALRLSFLMSLPIVLAGNILLNAYDFALMKDLFFGVVIAFIFGLLCIHWFMEFSKKVKFGFFVITFGILVVLAGIIGFF